MKKIIALLLAVVMLLAMVACAAKTTTPAAEPDEEPAAQTPAAETTAPAEEAEEPAASETEPEEPAKTGLQGKKIGFINAGADDYYAAFGDALVYFAKQQGAEVTELNSNYSSETELANCQDLIAKGVDAIAVITAGAAGSAATIKAANEAGIPIFFTVGQPEVDEGNAYQGWVSDNYIMIGYMMGQWVAENYPEANGKIALVPGVFGQNTAEGEIVGFNMGLTEAGMEECYVTASGEWSAAKAIPAVEDLIASGRDIDLIFACNEEMARGTIQVLEEKGLTDEIKVVSINGKEEGWGWLQEGKMMATGMDCPILDSDLCVQQMVRYFNGEDYVVSLMIKPSHILTKDNLDVSIPWVIEDYQVARDAGQFESDLAVYEKAYNENIDLFAQFQANLDEYLATH